MKGTPLDPVSEIPRAALRGRTEVWVVHDGKLRRRTVRVVSGARESVIVESDFKPDDLVVLTRLSAPIDGDPVEAILDGGNEDGAEIEAQEDQQ